MIKVLLADKLSQRAVELLEEIPEFEIDIKTDMTASELRDEIRWYDAVIVRHTELTREILQGAKKLKIIVRAGIDLDNIDVDYTGAQKIEVRNTPFATSVTVAEYTIAQMMAMARYIGPAYKSMKEHKWEKDTFSGGMELFGKTAGVIGFGRIGKEVAKRERALGMNVVYHDIADVKAPENIKQVSLKQLLRISDFISIHIPLTPSTRNLISAPQFEQMKDNVIIINTARRGVVDEVSLMETLKAGKIKAIAIDICGRDELMNSLELINHDRVYPAPFLGTSTIEGQERAGLDVIAELKEFFNV